MSLLDLSGTPQNNRVVVAMSGGVDSSVVAGLLQREGYEVIGITLQLYDHGQATGRTGSCCASQDIRDARKVAAALGIPHYVVNYESRFYEEVIQPFADSYAAGETPIPCISCNQRIKFFDMLKMAEELGAKALATGHYIRSRTDGGRRTLHRPVDLNRDQSYFLFTMTQEHINYFRFPLGDFSKPEVRKIAEDMGLPVFEKPDSQDICFIPQGKYSEAIARLQPKAGLPGDVFHLDGSILGHHKGIFHYTIGQRRRLGIAYSEPLYVVRIDAENACVIVGPHEALQVHRIYLRDVNWLGDNLLVEAASSDMEIFVKVRSAHVPRRAKLCGTPDAIRIECIEPEFGVAPGQACVFYETDREDARLLGGGFIKRSEGNAKTEKKLAHIQAQYLFQKPLDQKNKNISLTPHYP